MLRLEEGRPLHGRLKWISRTPPRVFNTKVLQREGLKLDPCGNPAVIGNRLKISFPRTTTTYQEVPVFKKTYRNLYLGSFADTE